MQTKNIHALKFVLPLILIGVLYVPMSAMHFSDSLDLRIFYTETNATIYLSSLTPERSALYFRHELLDLLFLILYTALSVFGLEAAFPTRLHLKWLGLVPGSFDFIETIGILVSLKIGLKSYILSWLGIVTFLKWSSGLAIIFLIFYGLVSKVMKPSLR
jgi:hypothetical protein